MLLCAHSASVFREGDETVLDTEIEAGLISVGQLVRFGSSTPIEPASRTVCTEVRFNRLHCLRCQGLRLCSCALGTSRRPG